MKSKLILGCATIFCSFIFVQLRLPAVLAWWRELQGDHAIFGIMAKHILEGYAFPVYYYGQNYIGPAESISTALISAVMSILGFHESFADHTLKVGPLALGFSALFWSLLTIPLWTIAVYRKLNLQTALYFLPILCFTTIPIFRNSVTTNGSLSVLAFGPLLWLVASTEKNWTSKQLFLFGSLLGLAFWTHQGIIFYAMPIIILGLTEIRFWQSTSFKAWLSFPKKLSALYGILIIGASIGLYVALTGPLRTSWLKIPNGASMLRDFLFAFIVIQSILFILKLKKDQELKQISLEQWKLISPALIAFLIAYAPVWLGRILNLYPKHYGVGIGLLPIQKWPTQFATTFFESIPQVLAGGNLIILAIGFVLFIRGASLYKNIEFKQTILFCCLAIILNISYLLFAERSFGPQYRYIFPSFFFFWLIAIIGLLSIKVHYLAPITTIILAALFFQELRPELKQSKQALAEVPIRKNELHSVAKKIYQSGTQTCWGDYWTSHLLTFLTNERVIFSPHANAPDKQIRIPEYKDQLEKSRPNCFSYRKAGNARAKIYYSSENPWQ